MLNEPGQSKSSKDYDQYHKSIAFCNIDFAICDLVNISKKNIPEPFEMFYPFMKQSFLQNYDKLLEIVEDKKDIIETYMVSLYSMNTLAHYNILKQKLVDTKVLIDSSST
jgi:hypothetical protein